MKVYFRITNNYDLDDSSYSEITVSHSFNEYDKNEQGYSCFYSYEEFEFNDDISEDEVKRIVTIMASEYNDNGVSLIDSYNKETSKYNNRIIEIDNLNDNYSEDEIEILFDSKNLDKYHARDILFEYLAHGKYEKIKDLIDKVYYGSASFKVKEYLKFLSFILIRKMGYEDSKLEGYASNSLTSFDSFNEEYINPKACKCFFEAQYNPKKEEKLLLKALKLGYLPSYKALGDYYKKNNDDKKAMEYYLLGDINGDIESTLELAKIYKDDDKEIEYLTKIYEHNDIYVLYRLANISLGELQKECVSRLVRVYLTKELNGNDKYYLDWAKEKYANILIDEDIYLAYLVAKTSKDEELIKETRDGVLKEIDLNNRVRMLKDIKDKKNKEKEAEILRLKVIKEREEEELIRRIRDTRHWNKNESKKDYEKKVSLYRKYINSNDEKEKLNYLIEAANLNHSEAMLDLYMYYKDDDLMQSYKYLLKACGLNNTRALSEFKLLKKDKKESKEYFEALILTYFESEVSKRELIKFGKDSVPYLHLYTKYYENNPVVSNALANYYLYKFTEDKIERKYICNAMKLDSNIALELFIKIMGYECDLNDEMFVEIILSVKELNAYVLYQLARIYSNESVCSKYGLKYSLETSFDYLVQAKFICRDDNLRKYIYLRFGDCFKDGLGVEVNYNKAYDYYKDYDKELAIKVCKDERYIKKEATIRKTTIELMNKYKCAKLDNFKSENPIKYKRIVESYNVLSRTMLEERLKDRDYLLSLGFTIDELYDSWGDYRAHELRNKNKVSKKEEEIRLTKIQSSKNDTQIKSNESVKNGIYVEDKTKGIIGELTYTQDSSNIVFDKIERRTVKEIRDRLACPIKPEFSKEEALNVKQKSKLYEKELAFYNREISVYKTRLFEEDSPYNGYSRSELYQLLKEFLKYDVIDTEFLNLCSETLEKTYKFSNINLPNVNFSIKELKMDISDINAMEKTLAGIPIKGGTIVISAEVGMFANEIASLGGGTSTDYMYDLMQAFEESDLSKWGTFSDFSRGDSEVGASIQIKESALRNKDMYRGKEICKNAIWNVVNSLFKANKICAEKVIKLDNKHTGVVYFVPNKITLKFVFPKSS